MSTIPEIKFVLEFRAISHIPADLVGRILVAVDESIMEYERKDLIKLRSEVPEIPPEVILKLKELLYDQKIKGLYLKEAHEGSIILTGVLAGVATFTYWLLQQTIGEDIKVVWQKTKASEKFKAFLEYSFSDKIERLITSIRKKIENSISLETEGVSIDIDRKEEDKNFIIHMMVKFTRFYPSTGSDSFFPGYIKIPNFKVKFGFDDEGSSGLLTTP